MRWLYTICFFAMLPPVLGSAGEPPVDQDGRPRIKKLGTIDVDKVENGPVVFRGKLYRCEWYRNRGCFHFVEHLAEAVYEGTQEQFLRGWFPQR